MWTNDQRHQDEQTRLARPACDLPARVDDLGRVRQVGDQADRQQEQPARQDDAAQPGRQPHADEAVAQPARCGRPGRRLRAGSRG